MIIKAQKDHRKKIESNTKIADKDLEGDNNWTRMTNIDLKN